MYDLVLFEYVNENNLFLKQVIYIYLVLILLWLIFLFNYEHDYQPPCPSNIVDLFMKII